MEVVACYGKSAPGVMKVFRLFGQETLDDDETTEAAQSGADYREAA